jgi:hypothetical protein
MFIFIDFGTDEYNLNIFVSIDEYKNQKLCKNYHLSNI